MNCEIDGIPKDISHDYFNCIYYLFDKFMTQLIPKKKKVQKTGRPPELPIQRDFQKKLKENKIQVINAQCQLQVCLAFKLNLRSPSSSQESNQLELQSLQNRIIQTFADVHQRELLVEKFKEYSQKWKFEKYQEDRLPEYLFDDGFDLSYIIYEFMRDENLQKQQFSVQELIMLELLCLRGRNLLDTQVMDYYEENIKFFQEFMKIGLDKINRKIENQLKKEDKANNQPSFEISPNEGKKSKQPKKTKPIEKRKKGKKSQNKNKRNEEDENEDSEEKDEQVKDLQLVIKTCNLICWAYWYVIKK